MNIFVFGSNLAGRHGKGAALFAKRQRGAIYGQGEGLQGSSYAIPTKDANLNILPLAEIDKYIERFLDHAIRNQQNKYELTPIGTGLAGYTLEDMYKLLKKHSVPYNVLFTKDWFKL